MPTTQCPQCNRRYEVAAEKAGKNTLCRACGTRFTITIHQPPTHAAPPPPVAAAEDEFELLARGAAVDVPRPAAPRMPTSGAAGPAAAANQVVAAAAPAVAQSPLVTYLHLLGRDFGVLLRVHNITMVLAVFVIYALQLFAFLALCFWPLVLFMLVGVYLAYLLNVIVSGATNEPSLPAPTMADGFIDSVARPLWRYVAVSLASMLPALAVLATLASNGVLEWPQALRLYAGLVSRRFDELTALDAPHAWVIGGAALLGLFVQPMMLLMTAIGGTGLLARIDLVLRSIVAAPAGYLVLAGITVVGSLVPVVLAVATVLGAYLVAGSLGVVIGASLVLLLSIVVTSVYVMRATGLFYYAYRERLPWSL